MMKRGVSLMQEKVLRFYKIVKFAFVWQTVNIGQCYYMTSSTFFYQETHINAEICLEVAKSVLFLHFSIFYFLDTTDSNVQNCNECLTEQHRPISIFFCQKKQETECFVPLAYAMKERIRIGSG